MGNHRLNLNPRRGMQHVFVYDAAASAPAADALNKDSVGLIVAWAGIITCFLLEVHGGGRRWVACVV